MNHEPIAYLGAGLLGGGMVEAMLARGVPVTISNRTAEKAARLVALGARQAASAADAALGAARVHLAPGSSAVWMVDCSRTRSTGSRSPAGESTVRSGVPGTATTLRLRRGTPVLAGP